ncbi:MAG: PTS sugar transporter subunit IIA [Candidatus Aminicenantes bacterium]|nr:PTS sugar transporter subunit IIA [Candidatus Aminicenantes bacterium]
MRLSNIIKDNTILMEMKAREKQQALEEMVSFLKKNKILISDKEVVEKLNQREALGSTALGDGIAIPHCKVKNVKNPILLIGIAPAGVDFGAPDGKPVRIFFLLISSPEDPSLNLQILALIAQLVRKSPHLKEQLLRAQSAQEVLEVIKELEEKV